MECSSKNAPKSNQFIVVCDSYTSDILYVTYVKITYVYIQTKSAPESTTTCSECSHKPAPGAIPIWFKSSMRYPTKTHPLTCIRPTYGYSCTRRHNITSTCCMRYPTDWCAWATATLTSDGVCGVCTRASSLVCFSNNAVINNRSMHRLNRFSPRIRV